MLKQKWPFIRDIPRYLFPFIKSATNVPGLGLCAFAALAVSMGRSADEAPTVRAELSAEVHSRFEWYQKNLSLISRCTMDQLLSILDRKELTAPFSKWMPMPTGTIIAANAYKQPFIYYCGEHVSSLLCVPYFSPFDITKTPGSIGFVNGNHFVSLELNFEANLPIPPLDYTWRDLHEPVAHGWSSLYVPNQDLFLQQKKYLDYVRDQERERIRDPSKPTNVIDVPSDDE